MALDQNTGTPPAVTHETLVAWRKLSDDITAALAMGGEQGLELLTSLMAEWCEAVEDVNMAREICVDLAADGRFDEALEWHADGFFDVADLLSTDRSGWDAWEEALTSRNIPIPVMNHRLKELADRIHEDHHLQDVSGRTLVEHVDDLRRNVLGKGHYGERLTCLEAIRQLHPAGTAWKRMIEPIRDKRASEIVGELRDALARDQVLVVQSLKREFVATQWEDAAPGDLHSLVEGCDNWLQTRSLRPQMNRSATVLIDKGKPLKNSMRGGTGKLDFNAAYEAARIAHAAFANIRTQLVTAIEAAARVPAVAERIAADGAMESLNDTDRRVSDTVKLIANAAEYRRQLKSFRSLESAMHAHIQKAPLEGGNWDEVKVRCERWLEIARDLATKSKALESRAAIPIPATFAAQGREFLSYIEMVKSRKRRSAASEKRAVVIVLSVVTSVAVLILLFIIFTTGGS